VGNAANETHGQIATLSGERSNIMRNTAKSIWRQAWIDKHIAIHTSVKSHLPGWPTPKEIHFTQPKSELVENIVTHERDVDVFTHDNRSMDIVAFLPPTEYIITRYSPEGKICGVVKEHTDDQYQQIADDLADRPVYDFGECWTAVGAHVTEMTGLDRMIFEDGHNGSGKVQRQGMNIPIVSKWRRPDWLHYKFKGAGLEVTFDQAEDLIDFWNIIDPDCRIWTDFFVWTVKGGIEQALDYFENLAGSLVDDEVCINDKPMNNGSPHQEIGEGDYEQAMIADIIESGSIEDIGTFKTFDELADAWDALFVDHEEYAGENYLDHEIDEIFGKFTYETECGQLRLDRGFGTPDTFRYNVINDDLYWPQHTPAVLDDGTRTYPKLWWAWGCPRYAKIRRFIENANLAQINAIRRKAHNNCDWMNYYQRSIFWGVTKQRKSYLEGCKAIYVQTLLDSITAVEKRSLTMMRNTKSIKQAKFYWYLIYSNTKNLGRPRFVEYVLKPELNKRQQMLEKLPDMTPPEPEMLFDSYDDAFYHEHTYEEFDDWTVHVPNEQVI